MIMTSGPMSLLIDTLKIIHWSWLSSGLLELDHSLYIFWNKAFCISTVNFVWYDLTKLLFEQECICGTNAICYGDGVGEGKNFSTTCQSQVRNLRQQHFLKHA